MCNYTQVEYRCGHVRYTVRAWCINYETTHIRCKPSVVAIEFRLDERCGVFQSIHYCGVWTLIWNRRLPSTSYQSNLG
ncbi:hypothetical protein LSUE1_G010067 [Lachnellula suecica]|uniref:Uncharacterized protein n=1 Tax=Lachnellula suecica TaxID=602035 RepID=A0A8T9C150_9HELO|nr:hypothetical protein LSUE1_G010067 [Lachnellula suecica]